MKRTRGAWIVSLILQTSIAAAQEAPLSAIDWVNKLPTSPAALPVEPPVSDTGGVPKIDVVALDDQVHRISGIVPSSVTGLPETIWSGADADVLARTLKQLGVPSLPAAQALLYSLLLAKSLPPQGAAERFQIARVDACLLYTSPSPRD